MSNEPVVTIIEIDDLQVASIRYKGKYKEVGKYIRNIYEQIGMNGVGAPFALYYDSEYKEDDADIEVCVEVVEPIEKGSVTTGKLSGGRFVSCLHVGPYKTLSESYSVISDFMKENDLVGACPVARSS